MFGLMKPVKCTHKSAKENTDYKDHRWFYCGVCKTIGRGYGQSMRLALNHDTTFLANLLAELSDEEREPGLWDRAYFHSNCLVMPAKQQGNGRTGGSAIICRGSSRKYPAGGTDRSG